MTRVHLDGISIIEMEPEGKCEFCGKVRETRPYGPSEKEICFKCAMATPEWKAEASRRFRSFLRPVKPAAPSLCPKCGRECDIRDPNHLTDHGHYDGLRDVLHWWPLTDEEAAARKERDG